MRKPVLILVLVAGLVLLVLLAACGTTRDRSSEAGGSSPDEWADTYGVVLVRNVDDVPNVALFCAEGFRFASTLSTDGTRQPSLVRVPEGDDACLE